MDLLATSSDFLILGLFDGIGTLVDFMMGALINIIVVLIALVLALLITMPIALLQWLLVALGLYKPLSALVYGYDPGIEGQTIGDIQETDIIGLGSLHFLTFTDREMQIINYLIVSLSTVLVFVIAMYIIYLLFTVGKATFSASAKNEFWKSLIGSLVLIALIINIGDIYGLVFDINEFIVNTLRSQEINIATFVMNIDFTTWSNLMSDVAVRPDDWDNGAKIDPLEFFFLVISFSLMQLFFFGLTIYFNIFYFFRKIALMILMGIGPIIVALALFHQFRSLAMNWAKALVGNIFIQSIHALVFFLMFSILIGMMGDGESDSAFTKSIMDEESSGMMVIDNDSIEEMISGTENTEGQGLFEKDESTIDTEECEKEENAEKRECMPTLNTPTNEITDESMPPGVTDYFTQEGLFSEQMTELMRYITDGFLMILIMFLVIPITNMLKGLFAIDTYATDGLTRGGGLGLTALSSLYNNARAASQDQSWANSARELVGQGNGSGDPRNADASEMSNAQKNIASAQQLGRMTGRGLLGTAGTFIGAGAGGVAGTAVGSAIGSEAGAKLGHLTGGLVGGTKEGLQNLGNSTGKQHSQLDVEEDVDKNTISNIHDNNSESNLNTSATDNADFTDEFNEKNNMKDIANRTGSELAKSELNNPKTKKAFMDNLERNPNTADMADEDKERLWEDYKRNQENDYMNRTNSAYNNLKASKGMNGDVSEKELKDSITEQELRNQIKQDNPHLSDKEVDSLINDINDPNNKDKALDKYRDISSRVNNAVANAKNESSNAFSSSLADRMQHQSDMSDIASRTAEDLTVEQINDPRTKEEFMSTLDNTNMSNQERENAWDDKKISIAEQNSKDATTALNNIKERKGEHANISPQEFSEELADVRIANEASRMYGDLDQVDEYVSQSKNPNSDIYKQHSQERGNIATTVKGATDKHDADYMARYQTGERKSSELIADSVVGYKNQLENRRGDIEAVYRTDNPTASDKEIEQMVNRDMDNKVSNFAKELTANTLKTTDGNPNKMMDQNIYKDYVQNSLNSMKQSGVGLKDSEQLQTSLVGQAGKSNNVGNSMSSGATYQQLASQMTAQQVANKEIDASNYGEQYQRNLNDIVTNGSDQGFSFAYNQQQGGWANGLSNVSTDLKDGVEKDLAGFISSSGFKNDFYNREDIKHLPEKEKEQKFQSYANDVYQRRGSIAEKLSSNNNVPASVQMGRIMASESLANKYSLKPEQAEGLVDTLENNPMYNYSSMQGMSKALISDMQQNGGEMNPQGIADSYLDKYISDNNAKTNFMQQPEVANMSRTEKATAWNGYKAELKSKLGNTNSAIASNIASGIGNRNIEDIPSSEMSEIINNGIEQSIKDDMQGSFGINNSSMNGFVNDYIKYNNSDVGNMKSGFASGSSLQNVSMNGASNTTSKLGSFKEKLGSVTSGQQGMTSEKAQVQSQRKMIRRQMFSVASNGSDAMANAQKVNSQYHQDLRNYSSTTTDTLEPSQINDIVRKESFTDQNGQKQSYIPQGAIRFVEDNQQSYVEVMDKNNMYHRVSNIGVGNPNLSQGEAVYRDMELKNSGLGVASGPGNQGEYYKLDSSSNTRSYIPKYESNTQPHELIVTRNSPYSRNTAHEPLNNRVMDGGVSLKDIKQSSSDQRLYTFISNKGTHHAIKDQEGQFKSVSRVFDKGNSTLKTGETIMQTHEIQGYNIVSNPDEFESSDVNPFVINKSNGEEQVVSKVNLDDDVKPQNVFKNLNRSSY